MIISTGPQDANANPYYRPILDIISEGIRKYKETHPNSTVAWDRGPGFMSQVDVVTAFGEPLEKDSETYWLMSNYCDPGVADQMVGKPIYQLYTDNPDAILNPTNQFENNMRSCMEYTGAGVFDDLRNSGREMNNWGAVSYEDWLAHEKTVGVLASFQEAEFAKLTAEIETQVRTSSQPVSASYVVTYFLEVDGGDLDLALVDSANYLKYQARYELMMRSAADGTTLAQSANWMQTHILDEYSSYLPYQDLPSYIGNETLDVDGIPVELPYPPQGLLNSESRFPYSDPRYPDFGVVGYKDYSLINRVGTPYHTFSLAAALHSVSPEVIIFGVFVQDPKQYGLLRWGDEVQFLSDLYYVEQYFNIYNPQPNEYPSCKKKQ